MATQESPEICSGCGIPPDKTLTEEEYREFWTNSPELHFALSRNATVHCPECGRQLTFDRNRYPGPKSPEAGSYKRGESLKT